MFDLITTVRNLFRKPKLLPWQEEMMHGDFDTALEMLKRHNAAQDKADGMVCECELCKEDEQIFDELDRIYEEWNDDDWVDEPLFREPCDPVDYAAYPPSVEEERALHDRFVAKWLAESKIVDGGAA